MKNIKRILLVVILLIPFAIKAETYNDAVGIANKYMQNSTYRNTYTRYLITNTSNYYKDATESFVNGGLLSYKEFGITQKGKGEGYSYLYDGIRYWTYTKNGSNRYIVSDKKDENRNKDDDTIKTKVTEFIKDDAKVVGTGTRNNPWVFVPTYQIIIDSGEHGKIGEMKNGVCDSISFSNNLVLPYKNEEIKLCLKPDNGYVYADNTCSSFMTYSDGVIKINKVTKDLNCKIDFGEATLPPVIQVTNITKIYGESFDLYEGVSITDKLGNIKEQHVYLGNKEIKSYTELAMGDNVVTYKAVGRYGNESTNQRIITIEKAQLSTPTNLAVNNDGIVTWNAVTNAGSYAISLDGTNFTTASIGINYKSNLTASTGTKTIYVKAIPKDTVHYVESSKSVKTVTVSTYSYQCGSHYCGDSCSYYQCNCKTTCDYLPEHVECWTFCGSCSYCWPNYCPSYCTGYNIN